MNANIRILQSNKKSHVLSPLLNIDKLSVLGRRPTLPAGVRIYAIGDIHGRADLMIKLLERIEADMAARPSIKTLFVFLGDYIDRGPSSRETIDALISQGETNPAIFLTGNHERTLLSCLDDKLFFDRWIRIGGLQTMMSYDVTPDIMRGDVTKLQGSLRDSMPHSHLRFLRDLQTSFICGDFFFVHAGVKPTVDLSQQKESDLLWIRDEFLSCDDDFGKIIVHGHTPIPQVEVRANRINIDTGAFATNRLSCLVIEDSSASIIDTA